MKRNYINIIRKTLKSSKDERKKRNSKVISQTCDFKPEEVFADEEKVAKKSKIKRDIQYKFKKHVKKNKKIKKSEKMKDFLNGSDKTEYQIEVLSDNSSDDFLPSKSEVNIKIKAPVYDDNNYFSESEESEQDLEQNEFVSYWEKDNKNSSAAWKWEQNDESSDEFEIDDFTNSRENILNESLTEAHSEIEDEFKFISINNIKVNRSKIIESDVVIILEPLYDKHNSALNSSVLSDSQHIEKLNQVNEYLVPNILEENQTDIELDQIKENSVQNIVDDSQTDIELINFSKYQKSVKPSFSLEINDNDAFVSSHERNAKYFDFDNYKLVILKDQKSISFYGYCNIKVLKGEIEVLGSILDKSSEMTKVYSSRGYSLLMVTNKTTNDEEINLTSLHEFPSNTEKNIDIVVARNSAVFICYKIQEERLKFVQKYISQQIFPKMYNSNLPHITFEPKENMNTITTSTEWDNIADLVNSTTRLFIAGGKGVGKSTFLRYTINRLLNKFDQVRVIDLDPGQSEFFIPGCVSIFTVTEPVIGPNFTHIRNPERSYLCDISVSDPFFYIKTVSNLMKFYGNLDKIPTLINYIGYTKGLGIKIASTVITIVKPTIVLQIESESKSKNFICDLHIGNIRRNCDCFGGNTSNLSYQLHKLQSSAEHGSGWKLEPRTARELCILSYFGEVMTENINSITNHNVPMYEVQLSSVEIRNLQNKSIPLAAINANLVALCKIDLHDGFQCLGFGVVRGVDIENDYLVLITHIDLDILETISHLVLPSISLPPAVYMSSENVRGLMPYVMEDELSSLAQLTKRSYIPAGYTFTK